MHDFPVLSAGPTPHGNLATWSFALTGELRNPKQWSWDEFPKLPTETITRDIHCVTKWSKLDTVWEGVSLDTLLEGVDSSAEYLMAFSDGGYTTNVPRADLTNGKAWIAFSLAVRRWRRSTADRRGCSSPTSTSGRARSGCAGCVHGPRRARFLGNLRLPYLRGSMEGAAVQRRLSWRLARVTRLVDETARVRTLELAVPDVARSPGRPAHRRAPDRGGRDQAERSYSISSAPDVPDQLALTVERIDDGASPPT